MPITFTYPPVGHPGKPDLLRAKGPRMNVVVMPHDDHAKLSGGRPAPPRIDGIGQLDTGADWTVLNGSLLGKAVRLFPVTNIAKASGPGVLDAPGQRYDAIAISLILPDLKWSVQIRQATVLPTLGDGLFALIGRDVLGFAQLVYDGIDGRFSVTLP